MDSMSGPLPPTPTFLEESTQVLYYLGLSSALGIGLAVAALTIPRSCGGLVSERIRRLALPAAFLVTMSAVLHFFTTLHGEPDSARPVDVVQAGGYVLTVAGLIWLWKRGSRLAGSFSMVAVVATASIPEIRVTAPTLSGSVANALTIAHILGALVWIGGLVVLAAAGLMTRRDTSHLDADDARAAVVADEWRKIWERFSVVALYAVGALIVSGSWLAWTHVGTPMQLLTTPYGRYLALKLCVVALLLVAGAYNTRVLIPAIRSARRDGDTRSALRIAAQHFPLIVGGESLLATAILAIVPFLRGSARAGGELAQCKLLRPRRLRDRPGAGGGGGRRAVGRDTNPRRWPAIQVPRFNRRG